MDYKDMNAIGIVRLMLTDGVISQETAGKYFPELAESEDEKIRKDIISLVIKWWKDDGAVESEFSTQNSMLAWLESQGEHKVVIPKFREGDAIKPKAYNETHLIKKITEKGYVLDVDIVIPFNDEDVWELAEQKPVESNEEFNDFVRWFASERTKNYTLIPSKEDIEKWGIMILKHAGKVLSKEQKHAEWSEEDECFLNRIITKIEIDIRNWEGHGKTMIDSDKELISWLKYLKERVQSKQEWNEEDRKIIIELIGIFESAIDGGHVSFPYRLIKDYIRVLKSCLPQYTWKPSKKQMKAIEHICDGNYNVDLDILDSIYRDFKKLSEE